MKPSPSPIIIERVFSVQAAVVWKAISDKDEMKKWYFDLPEFKPEPGAEFRFYGGKDENNQFLHLCKVIEVIEGKKLSYSWRYDGYEGNSMVTFELSDESTPGRPRTRLKLTHTGLETFPKIQDFARENFVEGWTHIVNISLKEYLDK